MERWVLAAVWVTLPLTAGAAAADALSDWSTAPAVVAATLCWAAWAGGLLAIVVPRPVGLTALRAIAPCFLVVAAVVALVGAAGTTETVAAVGATLAAEVFAARPAIAFAAVNAVAYGDEARWPLRVPPALFLGPLPAARLLLGASVVAGPLLLADERWLAGALAVVAAVPVVWVTTRALHGLSKRWAVLVPAGFVVVDPLTLSDPVLFTREHIVVLAAAGAAPPGTPAGLDLRLGAGLGSCSLVLDQPAELFRAGRGRRGGATVTATDIRIAVVARRHLLDEAAQRRIPVGPGGTAHGAQTAKPPPTSSSPS